MVGEQTKLTRSQGCAPATRRSTSHRLSWSLEASRWRTDADWGSRRWFVSTWFLDQPFWALAPVECCNNRG